jgi:hypothetical protein
LQLICVLNIEQVFAMPLQDPGGPSPDDESRDESDTEMFASSRMSAHDVVSDAVGARQK